ncbi:SLC13 family permease [Leucobacter denitrificans]|uniref:SLC13 family permease n=1 Tax=Leucobacter denitrificans TaxID=683042 RepID=A0A7G9S4A5_9MICO|nr:SLC13 family permease [Leucobacter denitrificans]QNN62680.1 SLC13 family permease [Leucobacter denitrificans]
MTVELLLVLGLLAVVIVLFSIGKPRLDVVALLAIVAFPLTGLLTVPETLAGFADPNVLLIAALFVVGEGLSRTGVTYKLGDWLAARAGSNRTKLVMLLMVTVAGLGAVMSSTGVVAIFIPVVMSLSKRLGMSPRQLMMPLSMAALISGMLTLIATAPNLVVDAELKRQGEAGFGFFSVTPFGIMVLVLGVGYVLLMQRFLGDDESDEQGGSRDSFGDLLSRYGIEQQAGRYRVETRSPLIGMSVERVDFGETTSFVLGVERKRFWRSATLLTEPDTRIKRGDALVVNFAPTSDVLDRLGLNFIGESDYVFDDHSRQLGMIEIVVPPESRIVGKRVDELRLDSKYGVTVLGLRQSGHEIAEGFADRKLKAGAMMLVAGDWNAIRRIRQVAREFVPMALPAEGDEIAPAASRAPLALASVALMIVLMVTGIVPNVIAALIAALLMGLFRAIDMPSAYRSIHWPTLVLIAGMLPFAQALEQTGGIDLAVDGLVSAFGGAGPHALLAVLFAATALIGLFVSNTATAVLMAPIAIAMAHTMGLSPYPFAMVVMLAASSAFVTPVSSPVNTLVMEPGRYRFSDFVRFGGPFTLVIMLVSVVTVPIFLPF